MNLPGGLSIKQLFDYITALRLIASPFNILTQCLLRAILEADTQILGFSEYAHFLDLPQAECICAPGDSSEDWLKARVTISLSRGLVLLLRPHFSPLVPVTNSLQQTDPV